MDSEQINVYQFYFFLLLVNRNGPGDVGPLNGIHDYGEYIDIFTNNIPTKDFILTSLS